MEEDLRSIDPESFPIDLEGQEIRGRIDIRYAKASGLHVIVELKRYSVKPKIEELMEQGRKYRTALSDILTRQRRGHEKIEVVFVIGSDPRVSDRGRFHSDDDAIEHSLDAIAGRYVLYDELIANACNQYDDYFRATRHAQGLEEVLNSFVLNDPE